MKFNLDNSVTVQVDLDPESGTHAWSIWHEGSRKHMLNMLGPTRYNHLKMAVEVLLKDPTAISAATICGITVSRGVAKAT